MTLWYVLGFFGMLLLIWIIVSYFSSRVAEPAYTVVEKKGGYEIRLYASYIEARFEAQGEYVKAQNAGFRILAGYIFGGNTTKTSVAMTAPVIETPAVSQSIAMTAPVVESESPSGNASRVISFIMPAEYTLATLPKPNDSRIQLVEVPAHTTAVLRYSWYTNGERVANMKAKLLEYLRRDGVHVVGSPRGAQYNPPWTAPFMRRNEILVDIEH
jgi:hypothetical protein